MAFDEAMLLGCGAVGGPILRFYSWREDSVSFGYSQRYRDVVALTDCASLMRRCTGGGLVTHKRDWTYSLVFPDGHDWYRRSAVESYRGVHTAVAVACNAIGVKAWLAEDCDACGPGSCFVGHERHDVVGADGKLAGAAQRRSKAGLLIQGSVLPPPGKSRVAWEVAFAEALGMPLEFHEAGDSRLARLVELAASLVAEKYSREEYLRSR